MDKTRSVDGFVEASPADAEGHKIQRLSWVFKWKSTDDGPTESARLVYSYNAANDSFDEFNFSSVAKPLHWRAMLHLGLRDGAEAVRRDIVNAHQSTRFGPDAPPCFTYCPPGLHYKASDGSGDGLLRWLNMLNGMPPVGRAFSSDLAAVLKQLEGGTNRSLLTDDFVWHWQQSPDVYINVAVIVDDLLVVYKGGQSVLDKFDALLRTRWDIKKGALHGFLNMEFWPSGDGRTVMMCMSVRLAEVLHEHMPDELDRSKYPPTPHHPRSKSLALGDGSYDPALSQQAHRLCAQLIFMVVNCYFSAQHAVFEAARYTSKPTELYHECLKHTLRHMYGARFHGLVLGGASHKSVVSVTLVGAHADAGHAQPGPSVGGHSLEIGDVTVGAVSGRHHATTLGTTDSETYEVSRAVAACLALRAFVHELGYPQLQPSGVKCDNDGTVLKSASAASDKRSLYMRRRVSFISDAQKSEESVVEPIASAENRADVLTKPLAAPVFAALRDMLHNITEGVKEFVNKLYTKDHRDQHN